MISHDGLLRIFWPFETSNSLRHGVLIGWRNSSSDIVVASVLYDTEPRSVENALRVGTLFRDAPHPIQHILSRCGPAPLQVLGIINHSDGISSELYDHIIAKTSRSSPLPIILAPTARDVQIVVYTRPHPKRMQFMSPFPMSLAMRDSSHQIGLEEPPFAAIAESEKMERAKKDHLVKKLKLHTVKVYPRTQKELALPTLICQINCSFDIDEVLQRNINLVRQRARRALSVSERVVESASNLWDYILYALWYALTFYIWPVATKLFIYGLLAHRTVIEGLLRLLDLRFGPRRTSLTEISASAQQVDLRLQQSCYWPVQYMTLREQRDDWESISNNHAEYIRFYNSLWLVANDIIIGIACGSYLIENADFVAGIVDQLIGQWSLEGLRRILSWLMVYPAGLKLNNELAMFLGDLFIWVIDYWGNLLSALQPHLPTIIRAFGFAGFAGASMPLSLASDLLSVCTLHVFCFYVASARIYGWQLTIITSLFHLFRGKKRNVLRSRIDSCDYELDQLLLGTILFTLLFFLLPTVGVFYMTFAFSRMGIICLKAVLDTLLACLNHFPLFALMLRVKDPQRLPGIFSSSNITESCIADSPQVEYVSSFKIPLHFTAM